MKYLTLGVTILLVTVLIGAITHRARADSLVCTSNGQQLIYTEVMENKDPTGVDSVQLNSLFSRVIFYEGRKEYRFGSIIPCVMIKEDRGETKFLEEYLAQFE